MLKIAVLLSIVAAISGQGLRYGPAAVHRPERVYARPAPRYPVHIDDPDVRPRVHRLNYLEDETPKPYSFSYTAALEDGVGSSSRTETADGSGRVEGSYSLTNDEGHSRVVEYVADEGGFRANVRTNEPGTGNQSPASVNFESSAPLHYDYRPELRGQVVRRRPVAYRAPGIIPAEEPIVVEQPAEQPIVDAIARRPAAYYDRRAHIYRGAPY